MLYSINLFYYKILKTQIYSNEEPTLECHLSFNVYNNRSAAIQITGLSLKFPNTKLWWLPGRLLPNAATPVQQATKLFVTPHYKITKNNKPTFVDDYI